MSTPRRLVLRILNALRPQRAEADLTREMDAHLTLLQDEFRQRGLTDEEARHAARRAFGGIAHTRERHCDAASCLRCK